MPLFEYRFVFHEEGNVECPKCRGSVEKLLSKFNVDVPDEVCGKLPRGQPRELCTECRSGGGACPLAMG